MKTYHFFRVQFKDSGEHPFFIMFHRKSDKRSSGIKGWCLSIVSATKKCFENEVTNPFIIGKMELAADFSTQYLKNPKTSCYFVNIKSEKEKSE